MPGYLDRLANDATRAPFGLHIDDTTTIVLPAPPVEDLLAYPATRPLSARTRLLLGERTDLVLATIGDDDHQVLELLLADVLAHHGGDLPRLVWLLDRYGDHIEADLRARGIDVLDLWRGRLSPRALLNQIDHLPRDSSYQDALAQDDEVAERIIAIPGDGKPATPRLTEFSPVVEVLAVLVDRMGELIRLTSQAHGGKPGPMKPHPRPVTAADRARARRAIQDLASLEDALFPDT